jgi:hypothetical protein
MSDFDSTAFIRLLNVIDALPQPPDDVTPLRDIMPGVWPTLGDLRALVRILALNGETGTQNDFSAKSEAK